MSKNESTPAQNDFDVPPHLMQSAAPSEDEVRAKVAADLAADKDALYAKIRAEELAKLEASVRSKVAEDIQGNEISADDFPQVFYKITIFKGPNKHDLSYVPVGVNGYAWKIERGPEVIVPSVVVDALNDAVGEVTIQSEGGLITRPAHRFPFQVLGQATRKEYDEFRAKNRAAAKAA